MRSPRGVAESSEVDRWYCTQRPNNSIHNATSSCFPSNLKHVNSTRAANSKSPRRCLPHTLSAESAGDSLFVNRAGVLHEGGIFVSLPLIPLVRLRMLWSVPPPGCVLASFSPCLLDTIYFNSISAAGARSENHTRHKCFRCLQKTGKNCQKSMTRASHCFRDVRHFIITTHHLLGKSTLPSILALMVLFSIQNKACLGHWPGGVVRMWR